MKSKSFLKRALLVGAACAALFTAPIGQAGTLIINSINGEGVSIHGAVSGGTTAGTFSGTFNGDPLIWWCVDLLKHVNIGATYNDYTQDIFQSPPLGFPSSPQQAELRTLFAQAFGSLGSSAHNAAAFQLAIWDILFDDDHDLSSWTATTGFGVDPVSGDATTRSDAQALVDAAKGGSSPFALGQLTSPTQQDFITPSPPRLTTPEPTGLALLGAGLVSLVLMRRRKNGGRPV